MEPIVLAVQFITYRILPNKRTKPYKRTVKLFFFFIYTRMQFLHVDNKDSYQIAQMRILVSVFVRRTRPRVRFLKLRLKW